MSRPGSWFSRRLHGHFGWVQTTSCLIYSHPESVVYSCMMVCEKNVLNCVWVAVMCYERCSSSSAIMCDDDISACFDTYSKLFFEGDALRSMLLYMCNKCTSEVADPVCTTLTMFLTSPVVFTVTRLGLVPFKDSPMAVFPYTHMTREQKMFILRFLSVLQPRSAAHVSTQLGGGFLVSLGRRYVKPFSLQPVDVLLCFCKAVLGNTAYSCRQVRLSICNVVLQRLGVTVGISRGVMQSICREIEA